MAETWEQVRGSAMSLAAAPLWSLSDPDLLARLDQAHRAESAVAAATLHLVREVEGRGLPAADKAHSAGVWLGARWRLKPVTGRRLVELGQALDRRPALDQALSTGVVNTEQAVVIAECVTALPVEIGPDRVDEAEGHLIAWAADFNATDLRKLADRILYWVAPEIAEKVEAAEIAKWEAALSPLCAPRTSAVTQRGDGLGLGAAAGPRGSAELDAFLDGTIFADLTPPDAATTIAADRVIHDGRRPEQRRADALVEVCRLVLRTGDLPVNGGEPPQVSVTVAFDPLSAEVAAAPPDHLTELLMTGDQLTPAAKPGTCRLHLVPREPSP